MKGTARRVLTWALVFAMLSGAAGVTALADAPMTVTGPAAGAKAPRAAWSGVASPEITSVSVDGADPGGIVVKVSGEVGHDAADEIVVIMRDTDGWELQRLASLEEGSVHELVFTPSKSGKYTFSVRATRRDEQTVHAGAGTNAFEFTYPLGVPVLKYAVNDGEGGLTVEWNAVREATGYLVRAGDRFVTTSGVNATRAAVKGLALGAEVEVTVTALRGRETGAASDAVHVTVSDREETAWTFAAFGQGIDTENNGCERGDDGSVRVYSLNGKGGIRPSAQDGLAFYYTAIDPAAVNFVLTATANVNEWTYSDGQEGFGLLVTDRVGEHGVTDPVRSDSLMAAVAGFSASYNGQSVQMGLGVGSLERGGVTEYASDKGVWRALDVSGFGTDIRNLAGGCTNADKVPGRTLEPALTSFTLTVEKDDGGYHVSYLDRNGVLRTNDYPDPGALSYGDGPVYVGMFAAGNADVTFTDIELTTSPAAAPGGEGEERIDPALAFLDPVDANAAGHTLALEANVDGTVSVRQNGKRIYTGPIAAGERKTIDVKLVSGANTFSATLTPDADYVPGGNRKLSSYAAVTPADHTVTLAVDERATIYVAPNGRDNAKGTASDPTTLAAAVKHPAPGATILLMAGTYRLTDGVTVKRGIDGTEESPITLKADPNASTRPVLDWRGKGGGLRVNADHWYLYGFDSTNSTAEGVHVGGSRNVVERVNTYKNAGTGLPVSRIDFGDDIRDWPSQNLILNCSAWLNADGFEAKAPCGEGNVFEGCIAACNAGDGWDLSSAGAVTVVDCVAFKNGYDLVSGREVEAGSGSGFDLGGGHAGDHTISNSLAFANRANGFTGGSNSGLKLENCTGFANGEGNVALYPDAADSDTAFEVRGLVSFLGGGDSVEVRGGQVKADYLNDTNYYVGHTSGEKVEESWFVSLDMDAAIRSGISRSADGSISLNGFLELTDEAPANAGARLPGDQGQNYRDIIPAAWYYAAAGELLAKGIMGGTGAGAFSPNATVTRAALATVLYRAAGAPDPGAGSAYPDVRNTDWFAGAAVWAGKNALMPVENGRFDPNSAVTRQDIVKTLYLYAVTVGLDVDVTGSTALSRFTDTDRLDADSREAMTWAVSSGIIKGNSASTLSPDSPVTRAELAVIVSRFLKLL